MRQGSIQQLFRDVRYSSGALRSSLLLFHSLRVLVFPIRKFKKVSHSSAFGNTGWLPCLRLVCRTSVFHNKINLFLLHGLCVFINDSFFGGGLRIIQIKEQGRKKSLVAKPAVSGLKYEYV